MKRMLINATQPDELRVAISDGTLLVDLDIEHPGYKQKKANIYKGRITTIEPSLDAVFVDYGSARHGFLPLKEVSREYFLTEVEDLENIDIKKVLKEGQELVVQVEKEERGTKGAALTTFISLAGSCLVLMPNNPRAGGISRRIEGDVRDHLKERINQLNVPEVMGIIIRTASVDKSAEELKWDKDVLLRYWEAIKQAAVAKPGPYLIHQESDVIIRAIRDYLKQDIEEIIVDEPNAYERARNYLSQIRPDFLPRLKLYSNYLPLFSHFQIEQQIEEAYQREVRLPSGGSIVIDVTEALISIDINSARATKGGNIEETAHNTNVEAAKEIARQLRIRDMGGLIVIDFIDMTLNKNQRDVENKLREALRVDRARIQIGRISRFGLLEMSRQRLRASLNRTTQIPCPRCSGRGTIRGVESMALSIIHLIQEHAARTKDIAIQVQLPNDIATYLLNEKRDVIKSIEDHSQVQVVMIPNNHLDSPQYQIKEIKDEHGKSIPSYRIAKVPKVEPPTNKVPTTKKTAEPVINEFLGSKAATPPPRKSSAGVIRRLWEIMFGSDEPGPRATHKPTKKRSSKSRQQPLKTQRKEGPKKHPRSSEQQHHCSVKKQGLKNATRRGSRGGTRRRSGIQHKQQKRPNGHQSSPNKPHTKNEPTKQESVMQQNRDERPIPSSPPPLSTPAKKEPTLQQVTTKNDNKE